MSRGRKKNDSTFSDWESVFYKSVGTYVQYINLLLSKQFIPEPLSKHIRIAGGYAFKSSEYKKEGIPVIRISDFSNEQIVLNDVVYYSESSELRKYELNEGDIVIALTGGTIAKLGIVQKGIGKLYLNQRVGKFEILHPDEFENEYVYWIARSVQSIIKNLAWGAAIPNVSPKQIEELEFPIPDKKIQKGIIEFLNALKDNAIEYEKVYFNEVIEEFIYLLHLKQITGSSINEELAHQLDLVKQLLQAFLREAMQGKLTVKWREENPDIEPASKLLAKIKAEKEKLVKEGKLKKEKHLPPIKSDEIPFDIPESWVWCRLGEIVYSMTNGIYKEDKFYNETGIGCFRMYNINDGKINFDKLKRMILTEDEIERYFLSKNDLLLNRVNSIELLGKAGIIPSIDEPFVFESKNIRVVLFRKEIIAPYINYLFLTSLVKDQILYSFKKVTGQASISQEKLNPIIISLPPLSEQQQIVTKLDELMKYCDKLEDSIKTSQQQNEMLLQQLLREALEPSVI
jgi:type I restriction enzyme S subunit